MLNEADPIGTSEIDIISHYWWKSDGKLKVKVSGLRIGDDTVYANNVRADYAYIIFLYIWMEPPRHLYASSS